MAYGGSPVRVNLEAPAHQKELARLKEAYDNYREDDNTGRVLLVHGPRGLWGETLLNDFKRHIVSRREPYFEAACEGTGGSTYGPIRELLTQYINHLEVLGLVDDELEQRFAEVGSFLGVGGPAMARRRVDPDAVVRGQIYFYEQLGELLQEFSTRCPAVLSVRDVHLADSTTRAAVRFLLEHFALDPMGSFAPDDVIRPRFRGFMVLTTQDSESNAGSLLALIEDRPNVEVINLAGVDKETVRRFLQEPGVIERFLASSGGNPDNLRAIVEGLPSRVDDLFERRLQGLDTDARDLLEVLAVYNRPATPELLSRLGNVPSDRFAAVVTELVDQHFATQRVRRGQFLIGLAAPHSRNLLYDQLEEDRRSELHRTIGSLLEEQLRLGQNVDLEELAHHFLHGDDDARAIEYALAAAERLHMTFAYQRATEFLVAILPRLTCKEDRRPVLERLIDLFCSLNDFRKALYYCGLLKRDTAPAARDEVYRRVARVLLEMGRYDLALKILEKATAICDERDDAGERVRLLALLAEAHYGRGDRDAANDVCETGIEAGSAIDDPIVGRATASLRNTRGKILIARSDFTGAVAHFEENIELARQNNWPEERVRAMFNTGIVALLERNFGRAEEVFQDCLTFGHDTANPVTRARCLLNLAVVYHQTLRWNRALEYYLHSLATFKSSGIDFQFVATALNVGELYLDLGDLQRATALVEAAGEVLEQREIHHYRPWRLHLLGRIATERKDFEKARSLLDEAETLAREKGWSKLRELFIDIARVCLLTGNDEGFETYINKGVEEHGNEETLARTRWLLGVAQRESGDLQEARELLEASADWYENNGHLHPLWEVQHELALVLFLQEESSRARAILNSARDVVTSLIADVPESLKSRFTGKTSCLRLFASLEAIANGRSPVENLPAKRSRKKKAKATLAKEAAQNKARSEAWRKRYGRIIGEHERLHNVFRRIDMIANSDAPVLALGESGTGKELLADAIHNNSSRADKPFVKVNCGAFVETLLLSELFGHEKGAFTGALNRKIGRFEMADGGTLFLDEIGDISLNTQVALLRVLQEGTFERVGGSETLNVDVRVVCATNRNLEQLVKNGQFRLDLYYRLKGVVVELPALRDRPSDIPLLVEHFLAQAQSGETPPKRMSRQGLHRLLRYSWPGNIRELQNFVRSIALFVPGPVIEGEHIDQFQDFFSDGEMSDFTPELEAILDRSMTARADALLPGDVDPGDAQESQTEEDNENADDRDEAAESDDGSDASMVENVLRGEFGLSEMKKRLEIECIRRALVETGGNITQAAGLLQMKRPRLSQIVNSTPELEAVKQELTG